MTDRCTSSRSYGRALDGRRYRGSYHRSSAISLSLVHLTAPSRHSRNAPSAFSYRVTFRRTGHSRLRPRITESTFGSITYFLNNNRTVRCGCGCGCAAVLSHSIVFPHCKVSCPCGLFSEERGLWEWSRVASASWSSRGRRRSAMLRRRGTYTVNADTDLRHKSSKIASTHVTLIRSGDFTYFNVMTNISSTPILRDIMISNVWSH